MFSLIYMIRAGDSLTASTELGEIYTQWKQTLLSVDLFFMINIIIIFWRGIHFMELSWRYQKSHLFVLNTLNGCLCCSYHGAD